MFASIFGKSSKQKQENSENIANVSCKNFAGKNCLYFEFKGVLSDTLAQKVIKEAEQVIQQDLQNEAKFCIVCGCNEMQDYDPIARIKFQKFPKNYEKNIQVMWIITSSKIIKYGGLLMDLVLPFSIKVAESEEQVKF